MICRAIVLVCLASLAAACTFQAKPAPVTAVNVYQSYESKVPGRWALYVDGSAFRKEASIIGLNCSAHRFPFDASEAFKASVVGSIRNIVDDVIVNDTLPTPQAIRGGRLSGVIRIQAESLTTRLGFVPQMWSGQGTARVEMVANVAVDGRGGRLLGTSVEGTGSEDRQVQNCGEGAQVLSSASEQAMKRLITAIAERIANSPRVRQSPRVR